MEYMKAFMIKLLIVGTLTFSIYGIFFHATIVRLLLMTFIISMISFVGDIFILPRINQALAAVGDFAGYFLMYWLLSNLVVESGISLILPALTAAYFGVMAEAVFHIYIMDRFYEPQQTLSLSVSYDTEFADEEELGSSESEEREE